MVTLIYNILQPEHGGVGRYTFELLRRMRKKIEFNEIDLSPSFGKTNFEKLLAALWKRKQFLSKQSDKFTEVNHFLQTEIFFHFKEYGKMIVTLHNPPPFTKLVSIMYPIRHNLFRSLLFYNRYMDALNNADLLIANSQLTKDEVVKFGADESRVEVVDLGVDEKFKIIKSFEKRKNVIGYIGSFVGHKRVDKLLGDWKKNFSKLKNYSLNLYGSGGPKFKVLKEKYNGKFNIKFFGRLPEKNLVNGYNSFKAFVFPSKGESFGIPIIEAAACGIPVFIYKDAEITPEVKKHTIKIESVSEVPEILENMKQNKLEKLSKKVKEEFNWDGIVDKTIKIYGHI